MYTYLVFVRNRMDILTKCALRMCYSNKFPNVDLRSNKDDILGGNTARRQAHDDFQRMDVFKYSHVH